MTFTNTWVDSNPPDTEAAALMYNELRKIRVDIEQRMGAEAGTYANMPSIESSFGTTNNFFPYFATDQGALWAWNGSTWALKHVGFAATNVTQNTVTNPSVQTVIQSVAIPQPVLQAGGVVDASLLVAFSGSSPNSVQLLFNSAIIAQWSFGSSSSSLLTIRARVVFLNATTAGCEYMMFTGVTSNFGNSFTASVNLSGQLTIASACGGGGTNVFTGYYLAAVYNYN